MQSRGAGTHDCTTAAVYTSPQPIVQAWSQPLLEQFANHPHVSLFNMVFVDALVFRTWPMRWLIARPKPAPPTQLYYFDNDQNVRNALHMRNLLSGYAGCTLHVVHPACGGGVDGADHTTSTGMCT